MIHDSCCDDDDGLSTISRVGQGGDCVLLGVLFKWYKVIEESGNDFTAVSVGHSITQAIYFRAFCN